MELLLAIFLVFVCLTQSLGFASINGHSNKLISKHHLRDYTDSSVCRQDAQCIPLHNTTCFGTTLPYSYTSVALAEDSVSQFEVQDNLALWQGLRSVPRCWAVVQPLLCAVYMPKCENGSVFLPSQEMCRITRGPCRSVEVKHSWPSFLRCENKKLFPPRCRNPLQEVKFNTSSKCISPLVETDNPDNFFHEVEGCGIQCLDPFFTQEEHNKTHNFIGILASFCFATTLFAVVTFIVSWKAANRYPGVIIFYINVCLMIVSFGWLIQFFPGAREEIVCLHDGTIRRKQPRSGEHLCSITFVLIYYFLMASIVWFVILTYAWHVLFRQSGTPKDIVNKKVAYFHISAWSIPLILTTTVMAMTEVDGDSMSGICFVGYENMNMRMGFLLAPILAAVLIGGFFLTCVLYTLIKVKLKSEEVANIQVKEKIGHMIFKIGVFSAFAVVFIICTFACHAYDFINRKEWEESLREFIVCLALNSANTYSEELPKCNLRSKPSIAVIRLHIFCLFGFGIIMSLWVWTRATVESWKSFLYGLCEPSNKSATMKRHNLIAKAFKKRHEINQGHISFSLNSTQEDPIGMHLDVNSVASRDISSSWAAALPQFLVRRNAVADVRLPFWPRQYSSASDVSRHISVDSFNQPTLDSLSMQISEQEYVAHALRHQRRKTRRERERCLRANRIAPWFPGSRRGSDTSLQSSLIAASIAAAAQKATLNGAKVTKSTSTGDLEVPSLTQFALLPPSVMRPVISRPQIQRQPVNPPFTHGMTDNPHRLDSRVPSVASAFAGTNSSQRFTPNHCPVLPNPLMGMVRPPLFRPTYDPNTLPYGYLGSSGMYPSMAGVYPGCQFAADYNFNPYSMSYVPYSPYNQFQQGMVSMPIAVDSASEAEYFPIMSDSEYTDAGHRSYDEPQLLTAHLQLIQMQEQLQLAAAAQQSDPQPSAKPSLEPQACAKTQFLKRMGSFNSKTITAVTQTSRPHSEAPPPSPAESSKDLNEDELDDDVFDNPGKINDFSAPLPHVSDQNGFEKIKSKFRRAASFIQNINEPTAIELTPRAHHSSLGQLYHSENSKDILKEKILHESEGVSLMNGDVANENISRYLN